MSLLIFLAVLLLVSNGLGAPVSDLRDFEKRRESTPEILDLEQELKKAAGEDKQYFSANDIRPNPQIDGLAEDEEEGGVPVEPEYEMPGGNAPGLTPDDVMGGIPGGDEEGASQNPGTYSQMWKMFKQNPDYFEDVLQDYMNNVIEDDQQNGQYRGEKRGSSGVYPYPAPNDIMPPEQYPEQDGMYVPSDARDRSEALMADYMASANQADKYNVRPDQDSGDQSESDSEAGESDMYEPEDDEESNQEEEEDVGDKEEEEEEEEGEHSDENGSDEEGEQSQELEEDEDGSEEGNNTDETDDSDEEELDSLHAESAERDSSQNQKMDDDNSRMEQQMKEAAQKSQPAVKPKEHDIGDVAVPPMSTM